MIEAVLDSTVITHLFRRNKDALAWFSKTQSAFGVTPITWLEVIRGAPGKRGQSDCKALLDQFQMIYLLPSDMDWSMEQMLLYRLSHGIEINDTLIASVCHRLKLPIYTHNQKDYLRLLPRKQVVSPY